MGDDYVRCKMFICKQQLNLEDEIASFLAMTL